MCLCVARIRHKKPGGNQWVDRPFLAYQEILKRALLYISNLYCNCIILKRPFAEIRRRPTGECPVSRYAYPLIGIPGNPSGNYSYTGCCLYSEDVS